jgi:hypothetical protein
MNKPEYSRDRHMRSHRSNLARHDFA